MAKVRTGPVTGITAQLVMLALLAGTVGLGVAGWLAGLAFALVANATLNRALARRGGDGLRPADWVTLTRMVLVGGVTALVGDSYAMPMHTGTLVGVLVVALLLDGVDGQVARRTGTASPLGARFDMEVDAFLIMVLSVYAARSYGLWVLAIGLARYAFVAAGWLLGWMRRPLLPRFWRKVVAAVVGIVLAAIAADLLPTWAGYLALIGSLGLLAESFGRDVVWLWRRRHADADGIIPVRELPAWRRRVRRVGAVTTTVLAVLLVWFGLVGPDQVRHLSVGVFVRVPVEGLVVAAALVLLPARARKITAAVLGSLLGLLSVVKLVNMGFYFAINRPFNPTADWSYFQSAEGLLSVSVGHTKAVAFLTVAAVVGAAVLLFTPLAVIRLARLLGTHRAVSLRAVGAFGVVWVLAAALGLRVVPGEPVASTTAAALAYNQAHQVAAGLNDRDTLARAARTDPYRTTPAAGLLTGLRGKDVIVAFVESYGRVAVQGTTFSPPIDALLRSGTAELNAAGFGSRSAFLTSPTFGGISWLAHSTLESGLWIDNQKTYNDLLTTDRPTLASLFKAAGWRTVADVPSNEKDWPEGKTFYKYDQIYDDRNVGYKGPNFSYASMPDQYIWSSFQRLELAGPHPPVMAEIDLVSSHTPWAPLPRMVDWSSVGDGSVFKPMPAQGQSATAVWKDANLVRQAYGESIQYSLEALISWVKTNPDPNLVMVVLGDHQPATIVSGQGASHDVPISIIAHDPTVLDKISGWGWQDGLLPGPDAPVWRMDSFRDRFLSAYGPQPPSQ